IASQQHGDRALSLSPARLANGCVDIRVEFTMEDREVLLPGLASTLRNRLARFAEMSAKAILQIAAELRRLNGIGGAGKSRDERVHEVKKALERRGAGHNRCC